MGERDKRGRSDTRDAPSANISPAATIPALDDDQLEALAAVGREWKDCVPGRREWDRALPIDPDVAYLPADDSERGRFVQIRSAHSEHPEDIEATVRATAEPSMVGRIRFRVRRLVLGSPLRSTAVVEQRMRKLVALPVLSSDALSSIAYGPEAMLAVLVLAGSSELELSLPIGAAIVALMLAVGLGYRQVIRAYPQGGGSYVVAGENLGQGYGLLAGAGLIVDYTLTVAVSIASGVQAVTSAIPSLSPDAVVIGLAVIAVLVAGNLRGVRTAGATFAGPTYMFVFAIALVVIVGLVKAGQHDFHTTPAPPLRATEAVGVLLVLRAFSSGATAMTGIEAISNSVPAFKPDEARNARRTLSVMIVLLVSMFAGIVVLVHLDGVAPGGSQTVLSKLAHRSVEGGVLYGYVQLSTTLVLLLAANTAFNGLPRLLFFMARDAYAPHAFLRMGDRLAFSNGIVALGAVAAIIFAAFGGRTSSLIPLYAVGVFLAFTLSQSGMVVHWWRHRDAHWRKAAATNAVGAALSGIVLVITAVTKFAEGAWVTVLLIPLIVFTCMRIHRHYRRARDALAVQPNGAGTDDYTVRLPQRRVSDRFDAGTESQQNPAEVVNMTIVPIATLDLSSLRALAYAASLGQPALVVHVSPSTDEEERFHRYWNAWGAHLPLELVVSPYRATIAPLANYIEALHAQRPDVTLTVVVPEIVVKHRWHALLHSRVARRLRRTLIAHPGIVIATVPFHLPS